MASKQQIQMFRGLVGQGIDRKRARDIVMKAKGKKSPAIPTPLAQDFSIKPAKGNPAVPTPLAQDFSIKPVQNTTEPKENIVDTVRETLGKRGEAIRQNVVTAGENNIFESPTPVRAAAINLREGIQNTGNIVGGAVEIAGEVGFGTLADVYDKLTPEAVKKFNSAQGKKLLETDAVQTGLQVIGKGVEAYNEWGENNPETYQTINSLFDIGSGFSGRQVIKKVTGVSTAAERQAMIKFNQDADLEGSRKLSRPVTEAELDKIIDLDVEADKLVGQFLDPSKNVTGRAAAKITPEILERNIKGTRREVGLLAKKGRKEFGKLVEKFDEIGMKGDVDMEILDKIVADFAYKSNLIDAKNNVISGQENKVELLQSVMQTLSLASEGERFVDANKFKSIKGAFSEVYEGTDATLDQFQNVLKKRLADSLTDQFAKDNPTQAAINKEFSFYANLDLVLSETKARRRGKGKGGGVQSRKGIEIVSAATGVGAAVGAGIGYIFGPAGIATAATVGGFVGRQSGYALDRMMSTPQWALSNKLGTGAQEKKALADAIANGDGKKIKTAMNSLIVVLQINEEEIQYEETQDEEMNSIEAAGGIGNFMDSLID